MPRRGRGETKEVELLRGIPLFSECTAKEIKVIASGTKDLSFPAGREICREGETGVGLHVIVEGEVKVQVGGRTRRRLGAGAFFGEIALLDGGPRSASVIAETPVRTLGLTSWDFKSLLKSHPELAIKMLAEVSRRLRTADSSINN